MIDVVEDDVEDADGGGKYWKPELLVNATAFSIDTSDGGSLSLAPASDSSKFEEGVLELEGGAVAFCAIVVVGDDDDVVVVVVVVVALLAALPLFGALVV